MNGGSLKKSNSLIPIEICNTARTINAALTWISESKLDNSVTSSVIMACFVVMETNNEKVAW